MIFHPSFKMLFPGLPSLLADDRFLVVYQAKKFFPIYDFLDLLFQRFSFH